MSQAVSHRDDLSPWNLRIAGLHFTANPGCCLSDYFNQACDSQFKHSMLCEISLCFPRRHFDCLSGVIQHVF
jgi:hypothetical protein